MKEKQNKYDRQAVIDKIENEYNVFRREILSLNVEEIFNACNRIRFYESIMEYFRYNFSLSDMLTRFDVKSANLL